MRDSTWENFSGTINTFRPGGGFCVSDPCWYDLGLPGLKHTEAVIECNTNTSCQNFRLEGIQLFPQSLGPPTAVCLNAAAALNPHPVFDCVNGTFVPM